MVHLAAVHESISAQGCARVLIITVFRLHGLPREVVSGRDPRFTALFWQFVFRSLETRLTMSTSDHPETDGQTERVNRILEEILPRIRPIFHKLERILADGGVCNQQLRACFDNAYTILRE